MGGYGARGLGRQLLGQVLRMYSERSEQWDEG